MRLVVAFILIALAYAQDTTPTPTTTPSPSTLNLPTIITLAVIAPIIALASLFYAIYKWSTNPAPPSAPPASGETAPLLVAEAAWRGVTISRR